jgi:arsenate reductase
MAEAWARHLAGDKVEAVSAGLRALGYISPETRQVMKEKGVAMNGQRSKGLGEIDWGRVELLVNMSGYPGGAINLPYRGRWLEWDIPDPFDEPADSFRRVRDLLEERVRELLAEHYPATARR